MNSFCDKCIVMNEHVVLIVSFSAVFNLLLIAVLSWVKSKNKPMNLWFGFMFLSVAVVILSNTLIYDGHSVGLLYHLGVFANLSFGGLIISVVDSLMQPAQTSVKVNWKLFLPSFAYFPFFVLCIVEPRWEYDTLQLAHNGELTIFGVFYNLLICMYSIGANLYILWKQKKFKPQAENNLHKRIYELLWIMLVLQLMAFVPFMLQLDVEYIILYMPVFGQIFFVYFFFRISFSVNLYHEYVLSESYGPAECMQKYATYKMDDDKLENIRLRIVELMECKKSYLRMDYSLNEMSKELHVLPNLLSMVINSRLHCSFPEYINSLRVKNAIELLEKASKNNLTIEAIAYDSGFNNRTSFYAAFKKETGKLPKDYLKRSQNSQKEVV